MMKWLYLVVLSLAIAVIVAATKPTITRFDDGKNVSLRCGNFFNLGPSPVWNRNNEPFTNMSPSFNHSRMYFNGNSLHFTELLPQDEGYYRCGMNASSLGDTFPFSVGPFLTPAHTPVNIHKRVFHNLKTSFNLPCGVVLGEVSRSGGFVVTWIQYSDLDGVHTIIKYNSSLGSDGEIVPTRIESHKFVIANFSLHIDDFTVDVDFSEQNSVITYECQVKAVYFEHAPTDIYFNFTAPGIEHITGPIITQPGQDINISVTFTGDPIPQLQWSLVNSSIEITEETPHFEILPTANDGDNSQAVLKIINAQEEHTGLLRATVGNCMKKFAVSAETYIIVVATIKTMNVSQGNDTLTVDQEHVCGNPTLHFTIPRPIPQQENLDLHIEVRFKEVLITGNMGETVTEVYPASGIAGKTTIDFYLKDLPETVQRFERYTVEILLNVNGTKGVGFSPPSSIVCRRPPPSVTMELQLLFEVNCYSLETEIDELADAVRDSFVEKCPSGCEDVEFEQPEMRCTSQQEGTFTVQLSAYGADELRQDYYDAISEGEEVEISNTSATVRPCDTCLEEEAINATDDEMIIYVCSGVGAVIMLTVVLVAGLVIIKRKRHQNAVARETDMELAEQDENRLNKPCPLPRSQISLMPTPTLEIKAMLRTIPVVQDQFPPNVPTHAQPHTLAPAQTAPFRHDQHRDTPPQKQTTFFQPSTPPPVKLTATRMHPPTRPHKTIGELASQCPPSHTGLEWCRQLRHHTSDHALDQHATASHTGLECCRQLRHHTSDHALDQHATASHTGLECCRQLRHHTSDHALDQHATVSYTGLGLSCQHCHWQQLTAASHTGLECESCGAQMRQISEQRRGTPTPPLSLPLRESQSTIFSAVPSIHSQKKKRRHLSSPPREHVRREHRPHHISHCEQCHQHVIATQLQSCPACKHHFVGAYQETFGDRVFNTFVHRHLEDLAPRTKTQHEASGHQQKPKDISPASKLALRYLDLPADVTEDDGEKFREGLWLARMYSGHSSGEEKSPTHTN